MDLVSKEVITTDKAPRAIGPYSIAVRTGQFVFTAGQLGIENETGELAAGGIEAETRQSLVNLKAVLEAAGSSLDRVIKTTVFLLDMNDFPKMNAIYGEYFTSQPPARSTVQVAALPKGGLVEIEAVAIVE
jgi:2-iminobutanoate/2-iminopropanoate deaminase